MYISEGGKHSMYVNKELPDVQAGYQEAEQPESELPTFVW